MSVDPLASPPRVATAGGPGYAGRQVFQFPTAGSEGTVFVRRRESGGATALFGAPSQVAPITDDCQLTAGARTMPTGDRGRHAPTPSIQCALPLAARSEVICSSSKMFHKRLFLGARTQFRTTSGLQVAPDRFDGLWYRSAPCSGWIGGQRGMPHELTGGKLDWPARSSMSKQAAAHMSRQTVHWTWVATARLHRVVDRVRRALMRVLLDRARI